MNTIKKSTYEHIKNNIDGVKVDVVAGTVDSICKTDRDGYLFTNLGGLPIRVHHIIGYFIFGERMIDKQINHFDGNKSNNRADNLEIVTPSQNIRHAFEIGLKKAKKGEEVATSKLTAEKVKQIRKERREGLTLAELAEKYGVAFQTVSKIVNRKMWTHVSDDEVPYVTTLNEYQKETRRTANNGADTYDKVANFTIGLVAEGGEVADIIKKVLFHGHELDKEGLTNELGDVLWYLTQVADAFNISLEEIANANIQKLFKRYPQGFSEEASKNRKA